MGCSVQLQEAQVAQAKFVTLRREHASCKADWEAKVLHLETQLANTDAGVQAQIDSWKTRAQAAEEKVGVALRTHRRANSGPCMLLP